MYTSAVEKSLEKLMCRKYSEFRKTVNHVFNQFKEGYLSVKFFEPSRAMVDNYETLKWKGGSCETSL